MESSLRGWGSPREPNFEWRRAPLRGETCKCSGCEQFSWQRPYTIVSNPNLDDSRFAMPRWAWVPPEGCKTRAHLARKLPIYLRLVLSRWQTICEFFVKFRLKAPVSRWGLEPRQISPRIFIHLEVDSNIPTFLRCRGVLCKHRTSVPGLLTGDLSAVAVRSWGCIFSAFALASMVGCFSYVFDSTAPRESCRYTSGF